MLKLGAFWLQLIELLRTFDTHRDWLDGKEVISRRRCDVHVASGADRIDRGPVRHPYRVTCRVLTNFVVLVVGFSFTLHAGGVQLNATCRLGTCQCHKADIDHNLLSLLIMPSV